MTLGSSQKTNKVAQDWKKRKKTHGWELEYAASIHGPFFQICDSNIAFLPTMTSVFICQNKWIWLFTHAAYNTQGSGVMMALKGSEDSPGVAVIHICLSPGTESTVPQCIDKTSPSATYPRWYKVPPPALVSDLKYLWLSEDLLKYLALETLTIFL